MPVASLAWPALFERLQPVLYPHQLGVFKPRYSDLSSSHLFRLWDARAGLRCFQGGQEGRVELSKTSFPRPLKQQQKGGSLELTIPPLTPLGQS